MLTNALSCILDTRKCSRLLDKSESNCRIASRFAAEIDSRMRPAFRTLVFNTAKQRLEVVEAVVHNEAVAVVAAVGDEMRIS
jgi:hypothetical protein